MPPMRVALLTDTHLADRAQGFNANLAAARRWVEREQPDLVVHLGDISADGESDAADLEQAARRFEGMRVPLRFLPGNHDIGELPAAAGLKAYRRWFGPDWWSLEAAGWRLIGLNAQLLGSGTAEEAAQLAWLEQVPGRSQAAIGLLLHKPLPPPHAEEPQSAGRYVPAQAAARVLELCGPGLAFVASGHTHQAHLVRHGGVEHHWIPSTSFCIPDAIQERIGIKRVGAAMLHLEDGGYRMALLTPQGMVRHNLLDFPQVYPQLDGMRRRLGAAASLLPEAGA
jgi:predicted phosphodiesterase